MNDVHNSSARSYNMSKIKGKNTKPELCVRKYLHAVGLRFRIHRKDLPGKPDIVLPKYKTIIFVHGCFWHGHKGCKYFVLPKTRTDWWKNKIDQNRINDEINQGKLQRSNWKVIIIWECELKPKKRDITLARLRSEIIYG